MKEMPYIGILMFLFLGCANGQNSQIELNEGFQFIADNFKEGIYQADLMTGSENNERRMELTYKMMDAVKNNYAWYVDFVKDAPNGFPVKYDKKLGLTEDEFREFMSIMDNYRMISVLKFDLNIKKDMTLGFTSGYNNKLFESLKIDLKNQEIHLGSYEFTLTDTILVSDENNRMGSKYAGYQWTYQEPEKIDFSNVVELIGKDAVLYRISFGVLEPSKKLYLSIKGVEIKNGKQSSFVIPIFMEKKKE
ncbi:MAG: hypothetical protein H7246_16525 [Phycisphaerae bacterium]|nr:hypothetical protein [Saprospiraceae bacterium]